MGEFKRYPYGGGEMCSVLAVKTKQDGLRAISNGESAVKFEYCCNICQDADAKDIAKQLENNSTLKLLDLDHNDLGNRGVTWLAASLKHNTTMTLLDLQYCQISSEGAASLAAMLETNRTLTTLDLEKNHICDTGITMLAKSLSQNHSLTSLNLRYNKITDKGVTSLADALKMNTTLRELAVTLRGHAGITSIAYLAACCRFHVKGIDYEDARIQAAQSHGMQARQLGLSPLRVPSEVFRRDTKQSARNTISFMESLLFSQDAVHQLKVLLVGTQRAGKTSLRQALKTKGEKANPTQGNDAGRATISVDIDEIQFLPLQGQSKGGKISLWDFGGQEEYDMTHTLFLSNRSLVMLVVDLETYQDEDHVFEDCAGKWLRALQMQLSHPKVLVVGTKCDTQTQDQVKQKMKSLQKRVLQLGKNIRSAIEKRSQSKDEGERTVEFEQLDLTDPVSFVVSGVDVTQGDSVANLYDFLRELASNTEKGIALRVPKPFEDLRDLIQHKRNTENQRVQKVEDLQRQAGFEGKDTEFRVALALMHDLGIILWYEKSDTLRNVVFSDPTWVVEVVRSLCRHDLFVRREGTTSKGALFDIIAENDARMKQQKKKKNGALNLNKLQKQLKNKCVLDERLLRLFPMWKDMDDTVFVLCVELLQQFDIMYGIPQHSRKRSRTALHQASHVEENEPQTSDQVSRLFMVPLFLQSGFMDAQGRKVTLLNVGERNSVSMRLSRSISSFARGDVTFSTLQRFNFFVFLPESFLFRVLARMSQLAQFTKFSNKDAQGTYRHVSGVTIDVRVNVLDNTGEKGSGMLVINCSCYSKTKEAIDVMRRTRRLLAYQVHQLILEAFPFIPFTSDFVPVLAAKQHGEDAVQPNLSYFARKDAIFRSKLVEQDRYVVRQYLTDVVNHQLEHLDAQVEHFLHVGRDIQSRLSRAFHLDPTNLRHDDPLHYAFQEFFLQNPGFHSTVSFRAAEQYLVLLRRLLTRLRTNFDCFLGSHHEGVDVARVLQSKGLRCCLQDSNEGASLVQVLDRVDCSHTFIACVTEDYLDAIQHRVGEDCSQVYRWADTYKQPDDIIIMALEQHLFDPERLHCLPNAAGKAFFLGKEDLFLHVLHQLFPYDEPSTRESLLHMYQ